MTTDDLIFELRLYAPECGPGEYVERASTLMVQAADRLAKQRDQINSLELHLNWLTVTRPEK